MGNKVKSDERRRNKKKSRKHCSPSSSPSSTSSSEVSTSSHERRQARKRKNRENSSSSDYENRHSKHRKRKHSTQRERKEKHLHKKSMSKRTGQGQRDADSDENRGLSGAPSPQEVVSAMLSRLPELANDLEQLLRLLDDGQAVDLSGLANDHVAAYLKQLFQSLQLQKTSQGLYFLPDGASKKTLDVLGSVLPMPAETNVSAQQGISKAEEDSQQVSNANGLTSQYGPSEQKGRGDPPHSASQHEPTGQYGRIEEPKRRVLGPLMPSAEMLEAASKLTEAGPSLREVDEDIGMEPFIGPPPPAAVKEAESANEAERFEEVERILAPEVGNLYELLGVRVGASSESLKKRYWKLSLLVHPDKCAHPRAHEAFTALNQAFKDLQDPTKRDKIDQQIKEKEMREEFEAEQKAKREAAEWRKIRGESLPGDDALLNPQKRMVRDEWMTELPPERKAGAPTQQSTFFSRYDKNGRGDTSVWTDTPMDRLRKTKMGFLEGERQAVLGNVADADYEEERDPTTAGLMDHFNSARRSMSLLEKHQMERSKKTKKSSHKKEAPQPAEWEASHPWKPWDREKDLTAGRQKVNLDKTNMADGLSSRFSASHKERSFL